MAQYADPDSTVSGGWDGIGGGAASQHAAVSDDSDLTYINEDDGSVVQMGLTTITDPLVDTGHVMRARIRYDNGNGTVIFRMRLYDQTNGYIATSGDVTVNSTTPYAITYDVTKGEAANITDYATLEVELYGTSSGTKDCLCTKFEFEVPNKEVGGTRRIFTTS